jgi:hypothetical protein
MPRSRIMDFSLDFSMASLGLGWMNLAILLTIWRVVGLALLKFLTTVMVSLQQQVIE